MPRSGIENLCEKLSFPSCGNSPEPTMLRWLADLSSRRLLNRIHHLLYKSIDNKLDESGPTPDLASLGTDDQNFLLGIAEEMNHQLHAWFDLLPQAIQPDLSKSNPDIKEALTILRYHAAGDIIHRPFLLQICALPGTLTPNDSVLNNAHKCLYHCRGYLSIIDSTVNESTASLEIFLHS